MDNINSLQEFLDYSDELVATSEDPIKIGVSADVFDDINNHFQTLLANSFIATDLGKIVAENQFMIRKLGFNFLIMKV